MKRLLLFFLLYIFSYFLFFFIIFLIYSPSAFGQNEPRVKFTKTKNIDEFEAELKLYIPDSLYLDLDNTYLSFIDNNPMSIDCGDYRILNFKEDGMKLSSVFSIENSAPPKFVRLQLVFWNRFRNRFDTKSEEYNLILENNFWVLSIEGKKNTFDIYFNDSNRRSVLLLDILGKKVKVFKDITSGEEVDLGSMISGIYFLSVENFGTRKIRL